MGSIGIIGAGTMGAGIAQVAAQAGNSVVVIDSNQTVLDKAKSNLDATLKKLIEKGKLSQSNAEDLLSRILWTSDKSQLKNSTLIIEAIIENLEVKQALFAELETLVPEDCILASNTSSLSITSIAASCAKPERVIGIHFFNPAPLMELVEVVPALQTSNLVTSTAKAFIDSWHKKTVLAKDTPGFIVNRIARPFYSEAIRQYEEGLASILEIDQAVKQYGGFKMGPFELMDLIGHDVNYTVTETVWKSFYYDTRYTPSFSQKRLVEAKWYGRKSGKGFYDYTNPTLKNDASTLIEIHGRKLVERILVMLINEAANALYLNIATKEDIELAMTKGVNYPKGLLTWADDIGIDSSVDLLDELYAVYHEDRYRCCPLLRKMKVSGTTFFN